MQETKGAFNPEGIFCSTAGTLKDLDNLLREFARYVEKAGVRKSTIHGLRHFYATENGGQSKSCIRTVRA
jgi:integrase